MSPTESDLDLLESYLDESLDGDGVEALRARLAGDAELLAALNHLREERAHRRAVFTAFEPDAAALDAFTARVLRTVKTQPVALRTWARPLRYAAAAAAFVAIGFFGRGLLDRPHTPDATALQNVVRDQHSGPPRLEEITVYQVTLRDDTGKVVAVQRFDSLDKAQEFATDLSRWQSRNERLASSQFVVTTDRF
jgi:anti-sigma factor RsiW